MNETTATKEKSITIFWKIVWNPLRLSCVTYSPFHLPSPPECLQSWPGMAPRYRLDPSGFCGPCEGYTEPGNGESGMQSYWIFNLMSTFLTCHTGMGCHLWGQSYLNCLYSFQIKYKKDALDNYPNFTSVVDPPEIVLAKINSVNQSDVSSYCICWSAWTKKLSELLIALILDNWRLKIERGINCKIIFDNGIYCIHFYISVFLTTIFN